MEEETSLPLRNNAVSQCVKIFQSPLNKYRFFLSFGGIFPAIRLRTRTNDNVVRFSLHLEIIHS